MIIRNPKKTRYLPGCVREKVRFAWFPTKMTAKNPLMIQNNYADGGVIWLEKYYEKTVWGGLNGKLTWHLLERTPLALKMLQDLTKEDIPLEKKYSGGFKLGVPLCQAPQSCQNQQSYQNKKAQ
ncbi:Uncharacterised protein [uncultured archaeon]|nr:Uncharacterised protein [uncultured archaeon]